MTEKILRWLVLINHSFPFAVGALAQFRGVEVLQPVVLGLFGAQLLLWLVVAKIGVRNEVHVV